MISEPWWSVCATTGKRSEHRGKVAQQTRAFAFPVRLVHGPDGGFGDFWFGHCGGLQAIPGGDLPLRGANPIAVAIGVMLHRKGFGLLMPSLVALGVMYLSVIFGDSGFLGSINATMAGWSVWTCSYCWAILHVASVLPVWTLLQPRDFT